MDNRVFNVNGKTQEELRLAFQLAFSQEGFYTKARSWSSDNKNGLVFHWYIDPEPNTHQFPVPLDSVEAANIAWQWLNNSDEAKKVELSGWFEDTEHDGDNSLGWRAYVGDWGHVGQYRGSIIAVTPAYLWHGK